MAQIADRVFTTDIVPIKENIVDEIFYLDPITTPFLQEIGMGPDGPLNTLSKQCTSPTYQWPELALTTNRTTLSVALTAGATAMTLADANWVRVTDRVLIDNELIDITTVAAGQPTVMTRGVGGTTGVLHAVGAVVVILGIPRAQGSAEPDAVSDQPTLTTNQTQIWHESVDVAGTTLATLAYGRTSDYDEAKVQVMRRIKQQLENAVLFGGTAVAAVGGATAGRMRGALSFIATNVRDVTGAPLDKSDIDAQMETIYNAGGLPDLLLCGSFNKRRISDWKLPNVRYTGQEAAAAGSYGAVVGTYEGDFGMLKIIAMRNIPQSMVMVLTSTNIGVGPLNGNMDRSFVHEFYGRDGDRVRGSVIGEYTAEWKLERSHALIINTSVS